MSQKKPFNRSPNICSAGKQIDSNGSVAECLRQYCTQDRVNALKHEAKIIDREPFKYKLLPAKNFRHIGIFTESRPLLRPPVKGRYLALVDDLKETGCQKYWTHNLGKPRDATGNLPAGYNVFTKTCGKPSGRVDTKGLINPDKSYGQVFDEYIKGHDLYIKSHNSYYPNERVNRNYKAPFNTNNVFGLPPPVSDIRGCLGRECVTNKSINKFTNVCDVQADFQAKKYPKLGKTSGIKNHLPEDHAYGLTIKRDLQVKQVLSEDPLPEIKNEIESYMCFLTPLRMKLKDRFNKRLLFFDDLFMTFKYYDKNKTGWIPLTDCYEVCSCYKISFDKSSMESYLRFVKILQDDKINYTEFMNVINWQNGLPDIGDVYHVKLKNNYFESSYNRFLNDHKYTDNSKYPAAGISSERFDLPVPNVPLGGCKADLSSMGTQTTAGLLISPTVYSSYGLSFTDFLIPRKKEQIKKIFIKIGYVFDDEEFECFWKEALEIDKSNDGLVCVETFKYLLEKYNCAFVSD